MHEINVHFVFQSDMYSFGLVLWEICRRTRPSTVSQLKAKQSEKIESYSQSINSINKFISEEVKGTLTCQTETLGFLLGLVVAYPRGFLIQMIFFHFWTLWVLSGLWFFKSAW